MQPSWHRYHRYMHIVEAANTSETTVWEWEGIVGWVKQLLEVQDRQTESRFAKFGTQFEAMDRKFDEVRADARSQLRR